MLLQLSIKLCFSFCSLFSLILTICIFTGSAQQANRGQLSDIQTVCRMHWWPIHFSGTLYRSFYSPSLYDKVDTLLNKKCQLLETCEIFVCRSLCSYRIREHLHKRRSFGDDLCPICHRCSCLTMRDAATCFSVTATVSGIGCNAPFLPRLFCSVINAKCSLMTPTRWIYFHRDSTVWHDADSTSDVWPNKRN